MMLTRWMIAMVCLAALGAAGCGSNSTSDKVLSFVSPAQGEELVGGKRDLLGRSAKAAWVDARSAQAYKAGHIPGAINLPYEDVNRDHHQLKPYDTIIVYGETYNDARANGMSKTLRELGYKDVRTLNGGIQAWKAEGNDVEVVR